MFRALVAMDKGPGNKYFESLALQQIWPLFLSPKMLSPKRWPFDTYMIYMKSTLEN